MEGMMKPILTGAVVFILVTLSFSTLTAQDKPVSSTAKSAAPSSAMSMPTPDPEMTKLIKMMTGTWTVMEKSQPNPMMPNGGTGKGTATLTAGPGGMSLMEKYHSSGLMGPDFDGYGTFWWDAKAQAYRGLWCDAMTPGGCDASGTTRWEGDNLGVMQSDMNDQKMVAKFTYSDWKPNSFVMTMSMGPATDSMTEAMTITYTRAGAASAGAMKPMQ
jgi:hypothetical protein